MARPKKTKTPSPAATVGAAAAAAPPEFAEAPAWKKVGAGWRPLFGGYAKLGFSFEWHEFTEAGEFDWARSFHPGSVELCLNLDGRAQLADGRQTIKLVPRMYTFYRQGNPPLVATREAGGPHRFITIEYAPDFIREHFREQADNLHPLIRATALGEPGVSEVASAEQLSLTMQQLVDSLRNCPVFNPAREIWFRCKALEVAAHLFFQPAGGELFCTRAQRLARERVGQAKMILRERLQNPPALEELSRLVHCSPFYLSRLFTQEGGVTMQQYLQRIRMERAAELLRSGQCNVSEAAFEVGYNSLSHFSSKFHEIFGCCPGLYPLKTVTQQPVDEGATK